MTQDIEKKQNEEKPKNDLPSPEQTKELEDTVRKLLNPNGENKQMDLYVSSTFNYIGNMFSKMQNAPDSELAAKEIAEDLKMKFENWANSQKAKQEETEKGNDTGKVSENEKTG